MNKKIESCIKQLEKFRKKIPVRTSAKKVQEIWGVEYGDYVYSSHEYRRKIKIAKKNLDWIVFKPLVKYIAISGSIASEFVKEDDDIDLFIVVKNDSAWIYRAVLYLRNIGKNMILRKTDRSIKDRFCINYICEERALSMEKSLFNLNELIYMVGIYNPSYRKIVFSTNNWLKEYCVQDSLFFKEDYRVSNSNYLLIPINIILFIMQIGYIMINGGGDIAGKILRDFSRGRIIFFQNHLDE